MKKAFSIIVAFAFAGTGCSSAMSTEDYAAAMGKHVDAYVTESQNLSYDYQQGVIDEVTAAVSAGGEGAEAQAAEIMRRRTVAYLALLGDAIDRYLDSMDALSPPASVASEHDEYVAAIRASRHAMPATRDAVEGATSLSDVQLALTASGFADSQLRWTSACLVLEQAVRDAGWGLNLRCTPSTDPVTP